MANLFSLDDLILSFTVSTSELLTGLFSTSEIMLSLCLVFQEWGPPWLKTVCLSSSTLPPTVHCVAIAPMR